MFLREKTIKEILACCVLGVEVVVWLFLGIDIKENLLLLGFECENEFGSMWEECLDDEEEKCQRKFLGVIKSFNSVELIDENFMQKIKNWSFEKGAEHSVKNDHF